MHNKSLQFKLNVISITINIFAIAMMFTFQYRYSVETVVYNENIWFGMFNLTGGNLVSLIQNSPDVVDEKFWGNFYGISCIFALMIISSLIYFAHHLSNYTFVHKVTSNNKFVIEHMYVNIDEFYYEYSIFPLLIFVVFSWFVFIFSTNELAQYVIISNAVPSPTLIITTGLLLVQIVINISYRIK